MSYFTSKLLQSRHSDGRRPTTLIPLRRHNLIILRPQIHPIRLPRIELVPHSHSATNTLAAPDRPVLREGRCADDRRGIGAFCGIHVVSAAVAAELTFVGQACGGVVRSVGFDDAVGCQWALLEVRYEEIILVLDQGVCCPAVDAQVGISTWAERAGVVDYSAFTSISYV